MKLGQLKNKSLTWVVTCALQCKLPMSSNPLLITRIQHYSWECARWISATPCPIDELAECYLFSDAILQQLETEHKLRGAKIDRAATRSELLILTSETAALRAIDLQINTRDWMLRSKRSSCTRELYSRVTSVFIGCTWVYLFMFIFILLSSPCCCSQTM